MQPCKQVFLQFFRSLPVITYFKLNLHHHHHHHHHHQQQQHKDKIESLNLHDNVALDNNDECGKREGRGWGGLGGGGGSDVMNMT